MTGDLEALHVDELRAGEIECSGDAESAEYLCELRPSGDAAAVAGSVVLSQDARVLGLLFLLESVG